LNRRTKTALNFRQWNVSYLPAFAAEEANLIRHLVQVTGVDFEKVLQSFCALFFDPMLCSSSSTETREEKK